MGIERRKEEMQGVENLRQRLSSLGGVSSIDLLHQAPASLIRNYLNLSQLSTMLW